MNYIYGERFQKEFPYATYAHTHEANEALKKLATSKQREILITHNSDGEITLGTKNPRWDAADALLKTSNVLWFGQNLNYNMQRLHPLPIGLENPHWNPEKIEILDRVRGYNITRDKLLYVNHDCKTNTAERESVYQIPWATKKRGKNGENYEQYLIDLAEHKCVACPSGNGWDCHRTWEALYMGCVPVMKLSRFSALTYGNTAIHVWGWDLEESDLNKTIHDFVIDEKQLDFTYWRNRIDSLSKRFLLYGI